MNWQRGKTIWFTGLSGSGKSTLALLLKTILESRGLPVVLLDGDILRSGLNRDLGFSAMDRAENIRRAGEVAKILSDAGHTVLAAFITPLESIRKALRGIFEPGRYVEIFLDCPVEVCETRDIKGLYCRARAGEIPEFTGISAPFERPAGADHIVPTGRQTVEESLATVLAFLEGYFPDVRCAATPVPGATLPAHPRRVAVIGLDGAPPSLIFGDSGKNLRNLRNLTDHGIWGHLRSTDPPITVPAWTTITTGKDPGELGIYGFRNRSDYGYGEMITANTNHVKVPRLWEYLESAGKRSILVGIPQTYPPRPHNGITVGGFLTPGIESSFTYPEDLADKLQEIAEGDYLIDVENFRTIEKERLLKDLHTMVDRRFRVASHFISSQPWDFFMMVEIATDRLHHAFWSCLTPDQPLSNQAKAFRNAIPDFYTHLDSLIGSLMAQLGDETTVIVLSDHGACAMNGGVCVNEWLIQNGLLVLREEPPGETRLTPDMIDWTRTKVWSDGGYYARIFLNVKGREPEGTVEPADYSTLRDHVAELLRSISDENGRAMPIQALKPEEIYLACNNVPPDLIVYFDDLRRRSIGTVGAGKLLRSGNDSGPDEANHAPDGIFIMARLADLRRGVRRGKKIEHASVQDITPTILHEFGLSVEKHMKGKIIPLDEPDQTQIALEPSFRSDRVPGEPSEAGSPEGYTSQEEEIIKKRLADLGYI